MGDSKRITTEVPCPVCGTSFAQRHDGRPKTCSQPCARRKDWQTRERQQRVKQSSGYIWAYAPGHPAARIAGGNNAEGDRQACYVLEHRLVMEQMIGRYLEPEERIHHRNGDRADNRPENLELWLVLKKDPAGQRVEDLIDFLVTHYPDRVRSKLAEIFKL